MRPIENVAARELAVRIFVDVAVFLDPESIAEHRGVPFPKSRDQFFPAPEVERAFPFLIGTRRIDHTVCVLCGIEAAAGRR